MVRQLADGASVADQQLLEIDRNSDVQAIGRVLIEWLGSERACRLRDALASKLRA